MSAANLEFCERGVTRRLRVTPHPSLPLSQDKNISQGRAQACRSSFARANLTCRGLQVSMPLRKKVAPATDAPHQGHVSAENERSEGFSGESLKCQRQRGASLILEVDEITK